MDDIIRPPRKPSDPAVDIAGVPVRRPAPSAQSQHNTAPVADAANTESTPEPLSVAHDNGHRLEDLNLDKPTPATPPSTDRPLDLPATETLDGSEASTDAPQESAEQPRPVSPPMTPADPNPSLLAEIEAQERADAEARVTPAPATPTRRKGHGAAILIAIIVALALVAGAGYAYWQNKQASTPKKPAVTTTQKQTTPTKNPATAADVDKASNDIDAAIKKIDETKEYQETDLSDATLGL
jgi:hypothetical protein